MENKQLNGIGRNETLLSIYNKIKKGELILRPLFQRNLVWNRDHKENFLETVISGYPFPEVYFAEGEIDVENLQAKTLVVDGQQRLATLYQYISGDTELILKRIPSFADLKDKEEFLGYNVVVRDLGHISDDDIKEIFRRINSVGYALNAIEINHALYDGAFISVGKKILEHHCWNKFHIFSKVDSERMRDLDYILSIMATVELGTYFNNRAENENYIKEYNDEYYNANKMYELMIKVGELLSEIKFNFGTIWNTKTGMFTLLCEIMFIMFENEKVDINLKRLEECLNQMDLSVRSSDEESPFYQFYLYMYQATSSKTGRITRGEILRKELMKVFSCD